MSTDKQPNEYRHSPKHVARLLSSDTVKLSDRTVQGWCDEHRLDEKPMAKKFEGRWLISDSWLKGKLLELGGREN